MTATILCVVGARPNFMKIAPIHAQLCRSEKLRPFLLHTGQHYDAAMKDTFFTQLGIPEPDVDLGVGPGSHAWQTGEIMQRFEPVLDEVAPEAVLVVGDVNSTIACGLVAAKKRIPLIHVEAGLRSRDRTMPEEINRVLTDQIADLLFTTERSAAANLTAEGIDPARIHFVGNVMIDALRAQLDRAVAPEVTLTRHGRTRPPEYGVVTLHRPANVDDPRILAALLEVLAEIGRRLPLIFPCHPRTAQKIEAFGLQDLVEAPALILLPPLGYLEMLGLVKEARLVLTDSGGLQEETTALGIPCITLRDNTERPITVTEGTNTLAGRDPERIHRCVDEVLTHGGKRGRVPEFWDGRAAERIVAILERHWG